MITKNLLGVVWEGSFMTSDFYDAGSKINTKLEIKWGSFFYPWWLERVEEIKQRVISEFEPGEREQIVMAFDELASRDFSHREDAFNNGIGELYSLKQFSALSKVKFRYQEQIELLLEEKNEIDDYWVVLDYLEFLPARLILLIKDLSRFSKGSTCIKGTHVIIEGEFKQEKEYQMSNSPVNPDYLFWRELSWMTTAVLLKM